MLPRSVSLCLTCYNMTRQPVRDNIQVIQRIVGWPLMGKDTIEVTVLHCLHDKHLGAELVQKLPSEVPGRALFVNSLKVRRALWGSQAAMGKRVPSYLSCRSAIAESTCYQLCTGEEVVSGVNRTAKIELAWPCQGLRNLLL